MKLSPQEIDRALGFAETVKLTAVLDPNDRKTVEFAISEDLPGDLGEEVRDLLDIAIRYYQRSIFTGEYLMEDESPPKRKSSDPIDDINFYLSYYKDKLIAELKKAFNMDEDQESAAGKGSKLTPYAEAMLAYRKATTEKQKPK